MEESRNEIFLKGLLDGCVPDIEPQSRIEAYLRELCLCGGTGGTSGTSGDAGGLKLLYSATLTKDQSVTLEFTNGLGILKVSGTNCFRIIAVGWVRGAPKPFDIAVIDTNENPASEWANITFSVKNGLKITNANSHDANCDIEFYSFGVDL